MKGCCIARPIWVNLMHNRLLETFTYTKFSICLIWPVLSYLEVLVLYCSLLYICSYFYCCSNVLLWIQYTCFISIDLSWTYSRMVLSCHDWYQLNFLTSQIESHKDLAFFFNHKLRYTFHVFVWKKLYDISNGDQNVVLHCLIWQMS